MKTSLLFMLVSSITATNASKPVIPTDHMAQFLLEKDELASELIAWKESDAGMFATKHGFMPILSSTNFGVEADEELRRLFLTKLEIQDAQATNPEATFSTETPFSLLTSDEFVKLIGQSIERDTGSFANASVVKNRKELSNSTKPLSMGMDWTESGCVVGVKNQGQCGSCWVFAAVAALESAICLAGKPLVSLSEQQLVDCGTSTDACEGGYPSDALTYIQRSGSVCTDRTYPYTSGESGKSNQCQSSCNPEAVTIQRVVSVPEGDAGLTRALSGQPVAVGVAAGNPTWKQYKSGIVSSCATSDLDHAVLAVGYTPSYFKIKNSWGTHWGENGYMRLKRGAGFSRSGTCGIGGPQSVYPKL
ncbi:hypothetical protein CCR75_005026 [Bremia lactucae]|uniref:Peptidase C1A papain C-terminal domain-containing protein n=1 Tax=Bremia lactucae TaxID=4779 RepID=A0A976FNB1_BRELC|nr:hypothetical protein CCR75_005026 [Bremia lactucae]